MRLTVEHIRDFKRRGERLAMLTAYEYSLARLLDEAGIPLLLVGDSLGMVVLGHQTTLPVTLDDILHHTRAVVRGTQHALIVADLPFLTYQISPEEALRNAGRLVQEGGAQAVKLEGGGALAATVARLVATGIPVMGHLGLTPQSVHQLGGYRVQARTAAAAARLLADAQALEAAGAFALVLETIPAELAALVTHRLSIPTIGIGAGADCDGQVQVLHDMLGLFPDFTPRHARRYANLGQAVQEAARRYADDVAAGSFPGESESVSMDQAALAELQALEPAAGRAAPGGSPGLTVQVLGGVDETRAFARSLARPLGLVPTMGALHAGHLSLVRKARAECRSVAASIFVNPAQFGPREDFASYPRPLERDLDLLREEGVHLVFLPTVETIYPAGFDTVVSLKGLSTRVEGAARPGHFDGVATVVAKLFIVVEADRAYFGQKDGQQTVVVTRMARDLNLPVEVVVCPTVRDLDGLALSSRNVYLSPQERRAAPVLFRGLLAAEQRYREGERDAEALRRTVRDVVAAESLVRLEYVSLADRETMEELKRADRPSLLSLAAQLGPARLIDNILLPPGE